MHANRNAGSIRPSLYKPHIYTHTHEYNYIYYTITCTCSLTFRQCRQSN